MEEKKNNYEILAPAGNRESFFAAINSGADAIYLGLKDFNARNNIENFGIDEIEDIVDYAHIFGVKVYVALNILIKDEEMKDALNIAKKAYLSGVDAFIVQDIGLASMMKKFFPEIVLHASTQMGIHNLEGAKFLESQGFKRVVLSRETPLEEIKRIHEGTNLEIEYFVQGALCVAFSGNCYLCSLLTGNSGNRGKCQQFCRLPYKMGTKEGYFLSAKDFCMLPALKELADAGVTSFKIEGRARRPAYIAGTVSIYKKAVNNNFKFDEKDILELKKLFNRGDYTLGYFDDNKKIYPNIQGHIGVPIGKVIGFKKGKRFNIIELISKHKLTRGDGLKFIKNGKEIASIGVNDIKEEKNKFILTTTTCVDIGADVHLTLDSQKEENWLNLSKKIKIQARFDGKVGKRASLELTFDDLSVKVESDGPCQKAQNQPLTSDEVKKQLSKLNDTIFEIEKFDIDIDSIFVQKSVLNDLRRRAVFELKEKIIQKNKINKKCLEIKLNIEKNKTNNNLIKKMYLIHEINNLDKIKDEKNIIIIYSPNNYELNKIKQFAIYCENRGVQAFLDLPIFATEKDILFIKNILKNVKINIVANNYYALNLIKSEKIIIGMGLNIFNNFSYKFYNDLGFDKITISKELKPFEVANFDKDSFMFAYGQDEYMTLRSCPFKEHVGGSCRDCKFVEGMTYTMQNGKKLLITRKKLASCQFVLKSCEINDIMGQIDLKPLVEIL